MMLDFFSGLSLVLEAVFLAGLGRFVLRNRKKRFLFWGWLFVLIMFALADVAFFTGLLSK
jgi:hypothetical protein